MSDTEDDEDFFAEGEPPRAAEPTQEEVELAPEPLFTALLRRALAGRAASDPVLADLLTHLATPLAVHLAGKSAKGGDFADKKALAGQKMAHYRRDQSLRAHLLNGLLPILRIGDHLKAWGAPQFRGWDEQTRRLFIAGYCLHDWGKLPGVQEKLAEAGLGHNANPNLHLPTIEETFRELGTRFNLEPFLQPIGGLEMWLHELIHITANTQTLWGTMRNQSALPRLRPDWGPRRALVTSLSNLADLLAYSAFTPAEVTQHSRIRELLLGLSNEAATLTYHHVVENRGVLTNVLHNAALDALAHEARVPLLYAPSGVVYLERVNHAPPWPDLAAIADATVEKTRRICAVQVQDNLPGFKSSPTGFRFPEFYWLFFDLPDFVAMAPRAAIRAIPFSKPPRCGERFAKATQKGFLPPALDVATLPVHTRVDQLAELLQLWERLLTERRPALPATDWLFDLLPLADFRPTFDQIVTGGATGGVAHNWYVAASAAYAQQPGLDDGEWQTWLESLGQRLAARLRAAEAPPEVDAWDDLRGYVAQVLHLSGSGDTAPHPDAAAELAQYLSAKKKGRGTTDLCSLCAAAFPIQVQQESATFFAPAVYSNRLPLHGGTTQRRICALCALEQMLRHLLMNHTTFSGKNFEGRKVRYLFFYPTYFFTPETLDMLRDLHDRLRKVSLTALRKALVGAAGARAEIALDVATLQRLEDFLLDPLPVEGEADRMTRMHYPRQEPMTFSFIGIPPGRDATDTESWVHPALLALLLPLQLDIKTVVSESPVPLLLEAGELPETVFLDGPASAIRRVVGGDTLTLDALTRDDAGAMQRLLAAYFIHLDAHAGMGRGGFDYRCQKLPALARDLATSPLYVFHYLKKWQRAQEGSDSLPWHKVQQYLAYYRLFVSLPTPTGGVTMSHAQELTRLYRQFYRAEGYKSNAILRPLTVAAAAILDADPRIFGNPVALEEVVWGEVQGFVNRVRADSAQGLSARGVKHEEADRVIRDFAHYFVHTLFVGALGRDTAALRGRQLNLLKNACEVLYLEAERAERAARKEQPPTDDATAASS